MGFPRVKPTDEEIEQCRSCKNAYAKCDTCTPGNSNYEKEEDEKQWRGFCNPPTVCETCPEYRTCSHLHPEEYYLGLG